MMARATRAHIPAGASTFGRAATFAVGSLGDGMTVVSDASLSAWWPDHLVSAGVNLRIAGWVDPDEAFARSDP
jgi:DeoR/GlpR family transcriptional regulator of sugar metabolism